MRESYRAKMSQISAPSALIERTKLQMYEENKKLKADLMKEGYKNIGTDKEMKSRQEKIIPFYRNKKILSAAACVACLLVAYPAISNLSVPRIAFAELSEDLSQEIKENTINGNLQMLTMDEYALQTGIFLPEFIPGYEVNFSSLEAVEEEGITEKRAKVLYKKDGKDSSEIFVTISSVCSPAPSSLLASPLQKLEGQDFYAGCWTDSGNRSAAWEDHGQYIYIESGTLSEKEFIRVLKEIFEKNNENQ